MKSFEYAAPKTLKEATELLAEKWGETEILAGGTDLVTCLKQHVTEPTRVVSLRNITELKGIEEDSAILRIGATTTLGELVENAIVKKSFPSLAVAAAGVGSPQLLSVGTVGGDLCQRPRCWYFRNGFGVFGRNGDTPLVRDGDNRYHAIFGNSGQALFVCASSLGPALIALGGNVIIAGSGGRTRKVTAGEFFVTPQMDNTRETVLKPNEILTSVEVPMSGLKNATYEVRHRHGLDWPYVTASVAFQVKNGGISDGQIVLGHVAPVPWRSAGAGQILAGAKMDDALAQKCADTAAQGATPLSRNGYKVQLVKAAVKRAILEAAKA